MQKILKLVWKTGLFLAFLGQVHGALRPKGKFLLVEPRGHVSSSDFEGSLEIAKKAGIKLNVGVYAGVTGPNLETRAEYRFLRTIGADAVGMSTVPEVIVANHMGLPCCVISVLTDDCDPDNLKPAVISEIIKVAGKAEAKLTELYVGLIAQL